MRACIAAKCCRLLDSSTHPNNFNGHRIIIVADINFDTWQAAGYASAQLTPRLFCRPDHKPGRPICSAACALQDTVWPARDAAPTSCATLLEARHNLCREGTIGCNPGRHPFCKGSPSSRTNSETCVLQGAAYASPSSKDAPSMLHYRPFESWVQDSEWQVELPVGEEAEALAVGERFVAVATSQRTLRILSETGEKRGQPCAC